MSSFQYTKEGKRSYLLLPTMPTPNGGLHLGHISGPYLKMDVMARAHRRNGSIASLMCGSDVYESYTTLKSWQTGKDVEEICNHYHHQIRHDLDALKITYDAYINPLDLEHLEPFNDFMRNAMKSCMDAGVTEIRKEEFGYSASTDNYLAGCWITGTCPVCASGTGSFQCEECGTHYRPMDIIDPKFRKGEEYPVTTVSDYALYLKVKDPVKLKSHLASMGLDPAFTNIVETYFQKQSPAIRLSCPDKWGTTVDVPGSILPQVAFTYSGLYFFGVYLGYLFQDLYQSQYPAFHPFSEVTTVASFGIDCSVPYMVGGIAGGMETGLYKPTDYFLPNHFFQLEGAKFSTSRGHAIWGNDIVHKTPATADAVRYFLILQNPEHQKQDFKVDAFISFVNEELVEGLQPLLQQYWYNLDQYANVAAPDQLIQKLDTLLHQQLAFLTPPGFELLRSTEPLQEWIELGEEGRIDPYWWLKGFSLLAYPIIPACAVAIWEKLGCSGNPSEADFFSNSQVQPNNEIPVFFNPLNWESLKPALPATLITTDVNN